VPHVQFYQFNRYNEVINHPYWNFDENMGFLWESGTDDKNSYGYITEPPKLYELIGSRSPLSVNEDGQNYLVVRETGHSPILGWAYDGNPIYGPELFANGRNEDDGIRTMVSGWNLHSSRGNSIPSGGDVQATLPPSEQLYPLGS